jgi:hypothetical protein
MHATKITFHTLVGQSLDNRPQQSGNCFGVEGDDHCDYRIVNFNLENLEALLQLGLTFPIKCKVLSPGLALIHDERIGMRWYQQRYCEVCCPHGLLPPQQRDEHERAASRGERTESENCVLYNSTKRAQFV